MAWPFPEYIRPLMRSVLYYEKQGQTEAEIIATLTGPPHSHRLEDVEMAIPEAHRAQLFAENIEAFGQGRTLGEVWDRYWLSIFTQAYGRAPSEEERLWARSRPGDMVGLKVQITVEGAPDFVSTPLVNVPWDASWEEVQDRMRQWEREALRGRSDPEGISRLIAEGAAINVGLTGGALVPRIEPTVTLGR